MAATFTYVGKSAHPESEPYVFSDTFSAGTRAIVGAAAASSETNGVTNITVSGGGTSWTKIGGTEYGDRRYLALWYSTGTPTTANITVDASATNFQEIAVLWGEIDEYDSADIFDEANVQVVENSFPGTTSLSTSSIGTFGTGDLGIFVGAIEKASDGLAADTNNEFISSSPKSSIEDAGNIRGIALFRTSSDTTPGMTWTTQGFAGIIAIRVNAAAGGSTTPQTIAATAGSTASLANVITTVKTIAATAGSTLVLTPLQIAGKTIAATAGSTVTFVKQVSKTIAASTTTVASIVKQVSKTIAASTAAVASATPVAVFPRTIAAVATVVATVAASPLILKAISAVAGATATVATLFIEGLLYPIRDLLRPANRDLSRPDDHELYGMLDDFDP